MPASIIPNLQNTATVIVVAIPDAAATQRITETVRRLNPKGHIIIRTRFLQEVEQLYKLGADDVIPEEFETSIQIFTRVLTRFTVPQKEINNVVSDIRAECYHIFRKTEASEELQARLDVNQNTTLH